MRMGRSSRAGSATVARLPRVAGQASAQRGVRQRQRSRLTAPRAGQPGACQPIAALEAADDGQFDGVRDDERWVVIHDATKWAAGGDAGMLSVVAGDSHGGLAVFAPAVDLKELLSLAGTSEDGTRQRCGVDGVSARVVHPAPAEDRVLGGADQPSVTAVQGRAAVCERNLMNRPVTSFDENGLDPDRTGRVIEPVARHAHDVRDVLALAPAAAGQPRRQEFELGGVQLRSVQQRHTPNRRDTFVLRTHQPAA